MIPTQVFYDSDGKAYTPSDDLAPNLTMHYSDTKEHVFTTHEGGMTEDIILLVLQEMGMLE